MSAPAPPHEALFTQYATDEQCCPGLLSEILGKLRSFLGDLYSLGYTYEVEAPSVVKLGILGASSHDILTELDPLLEQAKREADDKGRNAHLKSLPKAQRHHELVTIVLKKLYRNVAGIYFGLLIVRARLTQFFMLNTKRRTTSLNQDEQKEYEIAEILVASLLEHGALSVVLKCFELELTRAHTIVSNILLKTRNFALSYRSEINHKVIGYTVGLNTKTSSLMPAIAAADTTVTGNDIARSVAATDIVIETDDLDKSRTKSGDIPSKLPNLGDAYRGAVKAKHFKDDYIKILDIVGDRAGVVDRSLAASLAILPALPLNQVPHYRSSPFIETDSGGVNTISIARAILKSNDVMQRALEEGNTRRIMIANVVADDFAWRLRIAPFWYTQTANLRRFYRAMVSVSVGVFPYYLSTSNCGKTCAISCKTCGAFVCYENSRKAYYEMTPKTDIRYSQYFWNLPDAGLVRGTAMSPWFMPSVKINEHFVLPAPPSSSLEADHVLQGLFTSVWLVCGTKLPEETVRHLTMPPADADDSFDTDVDDMPCPPPKGIVEIDRKRRVTFEPQLKVLPPMEQRPKVVVLLHIHGGGFVSMSARSHEIYIREWVKLFKKNPKKEQEIPQSGGFSTLKQRSDEPDIEDLPVVVLSLNYRHAPFFKYPTQIAEAVRLYRWIRSPSFPCDVHRVVVCGDSAGGYLATLMMMYCIIDDVPTPDGSVLFYPAVNLHNNLTISKLMMSGDVMIPLRFLCHCLIAYLPKHVKTNHPLVSPLFAPDEILSKFPPTHVIGSAFDPLLDDYALFARRLRLAGANASFTCMPNVPHGFLNFGPGLPPSAYYVRMAGNLLRDMLKTNVL